MALVVKNPPSNAGDIRDWSSTPGLGRSPRGGHGNLLQYSCLENPMDRGGWRAIVNRVTKNQHYWVTSVQFSHSVMSNSLWPHGLQNTRLPYTSPTPGAYSNSCPSSRWCHSTISSSVVPFSYLQSFSASGSFPMSHFFVSGAKVLEFQFQLQSFQWLFRTDFL